MREYMESRSLLSKVEEKAEELNIDIDFLYPVVEYMGKNIVASEDDILRAYFNAETKRLNNCSPEAAKPASKKLVEIASRGKYVPPVTAFIMPGEYVSQLHIDIYERLIAIRTDIMLRFFLQAGSRKINDIIKYLCWDIIQTMRDTRISLN